MLIKLPEWLQKINNLNFPHKGTVLDNVDPKKLGRVKVQILELLEGTASQLPWVYPQNPYGLGGKSNSSGFSVPEIGSELIIVFPYDDIYFPFYTGYWQSEGTHQSLFDEDYPNSYGFRDSLGNYVKINKTQKTLDLRHSSGAQIQIDAAGNVTITTPQDNDEVVAGDKRITVTGDLDVTVSGAVTITSDSLVTLDGGSGDVSGVVTKNCVCPVLGEGHFDFSEEVKASK